MIFEPIDGLSRALLVPLVLSFAFLSRASVASAQAAGASTAAAPAESARPEWMTTSAVAIEADLVARHGEGQRARARRGLAQAADFWRAEDGDEAAFREFAMTHFAGDRATLDTTFDRFQSLLAQLDGRMNEIGREFRQQAELDLGPILPFDELFAAYDPSAHLADDFFENKLAFVVLLNFPLTTLEERLGAGASWTRREWAEARLAQRFSKRVPASVNTVIAEAIAKSEQYIAGYNIWMHHVVSTSGERLFPARMRLLSHWNLRDQIKADYSDRAAGLPRQRAIQTIMERIVTQTIPEVVIDNPHVDWNPVTNAVRPAAADAKDSDEPAPADLRVSSDPEPDTRYAMLLADFHAMKGVDPYSPTAPTFIARRFEENREIPEPRVREIFEQVLTSPLVPRVARRIETRLGRPLEPFDIWYNGFRPRGERSETELDAICKAKYPNATAFADDMPRLLVDLGFSKPRADELAANIVVDPARGSGHALGAQMASEKTHLRTRVEKDGMNYKGYNIAIHEMGHNVEQTFSLNEIDHWLLRGVPNNAFTEALAFVFQGHDLELLGLAKPDAQSEALQALNDFWATYEIAGVALVDMAVWHWMYDHPDATPAQLRDATVAIAKETWNRYYAPVLGKRDAVLLGVYSHMINSFLYLPDYPLGHLIAHQVEETMRAKGAIGPEFERMATFGSLAPDLWMKNATGAPVGAEALLAATERALGAVAQ
jgi:hypothetical protein